MIVCLISISDILQTGSLSAVSILSEVLRVDTLQKSKIFVYLDAFAEIMGHLLAFGYLVGSQKSIVIQTLHVSSLIRETRQLLIGLGYEKHTLYSWN